jgi:hypothetical protein
VLQWHSMGCFRAHIQSRVLSHPVPSLYPLYFCILLLLSSSVVHLNPSYCFCYYYAISVVIVCCCYVLLFPFFYCFLLLLKLFNFFIVYCSYYKFSRFLLFVVVIRVLYLILIVCFCYGALKAVVVPEIESSIKTMCYVFLDGLYFFLLFQKVTYPVH